MERVRIDVSIKSGIFIKDPLETDLGKKIIKSAIDLIYKVGFEELNFKKLAKDAGTTEASAYRYFENKYKLIIYLTAWYWDFMHFMIMLDIRNIKNPKDQLKQSISTLINTDNNIITPDYIDLAKLHKIIIENGSKLYHTKNVDKLNKEGYYSNYKKIVKTISEIIMKVDVNFKYPNAVASTLLEQSLNNEYYIEHLPSLTDESSSKKDPAFQTVNMINYIIDKIF